MKKPGTEDGILAAKLILDHASSGAISVHLQDSAEPGKMPRHDCLQSVRSRLADCPHQKNAIACIGRKPCLGGLSRTGSQSGQGRLIGENPFPFVERVPGCNRRISRSPDVPSIAPSTPAYLDAILQTFMMAIRLAIRSLALFSAAFQRRRRAEPERIPI